MKGPEASFWRWLDGQLSEDWLRTRIESTTMNGIPDVWICHRQGPLSYWLELKACPTTNIQVRSVQYAWACSRCTEHFGPLVLNRDPKTRVVSIYHLPLAQVVQGRAGHLKILSEPLWRGPMHEFAPWFHHMTT